jgi:Spy/CpxP family protein refolding chaperone
MMNRIPRTLARPLAVAVLALGTVAAYAQPGPMAGQGPMMAGSGPMAGHGPMMGSHGGGMMMGGHGAMMGDHGPGAMMGGMMYRLLDRVNATPEQRTQIQQIMTRMRSEMQAEHDAGRGQRDEAMALFAQPNIDAAAAEALRQKMQARHDAASKRMLQGMLEIAKVLTPEQRKQMAEFSRQRRDMMERHRRERMGLEGAGR